MSHLEDNIQTKERGHSYLSFTMAATPISILTKVKGKQLGWGEGLGQ